MSLLFLLFRCSALLALAGIGVGVLLHLTNPRSAKIHKILWLLALLQGVLIGVIPLKIENRPMKSEIEPVSLRPISGSAAIELKSNAVKRIPEEWEARESAFSVRVSPVPETQRTQFPPWDTILFRIWSGVFALLVFWKAFTYLRLLFFLRKAKPIDGEFRGEWNKILAENKIAFERIPLLTTQRIGPLMLCGLTGQTAVYVPVTLWEDLSPSVREGILRHELAHVLAKDNLVSLLVQFLAMLHWFNPVAWYAYRKYEEAAEWNADEFAFGRSESAPYDFAETLLSVHDRGRRFTLKYRSSFYGGNLRRRLSRLDHFTTHPGEPVMKKILILVTCFVFIACGLFRIELIAKDESQKSNGVNTKTILDSDGFQYEKYDVGKKVKDFPKTDDFSTPEAAYATIERQGIEGRLDWTAASVKRYAELFKGDKIAPPLTGEQAERKWDCDVVNVRIHENYARVAAYVSGLGVEEPYYDLRSFEKENGKWLNSGNDHARKLEDDDQKFKRICDYAKAEFAEKSQLKKTLEIYKNRIKTYEVNKSTAAFAEKEDFSTPEGLCVYVNRKLAEGDVDGLNKVNKNKPSASETARIKNPSKEWAEVLRNAEIFKVRIFSNRFAVVSQLLGESGVDIRVMEFRGGKWINLGNDRANSDEDVEMGFANRLESWDKELQENSKPIQGRVVDASGQGIAGAEVQFTPSNGSEQPVSAKTDENGYYSVPASP